MNPQEYQPGPQRKWFQLVIGAFLCPILVLGRGILRAYQRAGLKRVAVGMSVLGNVLFVLVLAIGYMQSDPSDEWMHGSANIPDPLVQIAEGPFYLCEAPKSSELGRIYPGAVYVASLGLIRARFEMVGDSRETLATVTVCDLHGRPFVSVDHMDGSFIYERYAGPEDLEPVSSLLDKDGDGIPEVMINWLGGERFRRSEDVAWQLVVKD